MLHFEGDREFGLPPVDLWARFHDARFLVRAIPGAEMIGEATTERAVCKIHPGLSFVRGTLEVTLQVVEAVEPGSVRLLLQSKGIGSSSTVEAALALAPQGAGTHVHWTADVSSLGGLLKAVPQGLIQGAAQKVIDDLWEGVSARLRTEAPGA